jgi:opacity protein-like surface antigen
VEDTVSFGDSLDDLDFGLVLALEASRDRWKIGTELMYSKSSSGNSYTGGPEFSRVDTESQSTFLTLEASYAVIDDEDLAIDLGGGLRYVRLDVDTTLRGGTSPTQKSGSLDEWTEPLVVGRIRYAFSPDWYGVLYGDAGASLGDDSGSTWQVVATVGYRLNERVNIQGGWRHFDVDTNNDSNLRLQLSGPIVGATVSF